MVRDLQNYVNNGYKIVTWNGCGFDFAVLAHESGLVHECAALALDHIDLMLIVTFTKGWYLSLQKALIGAGLKGKRKKVTLNDGTILRDMSGGMAPKLWRDGEYSAVLSYLSDDVTELVALAENIERQKVIRWTSTNGKPMFLSVPDLLTVQKCFRIPKPDTSWMKDAPTREQFIDWMPQHFSRK